jgi:hypothetical protein
MQSSNWSWRETSRKVGILWLHGWLVVPLPCAILGTQRIVYSTDSGFWWTHQRNTARLWTYFILHFFCTPLRSDSQRQLKSLSLEIYFSCAPWHWNHCKVCGRPGLWWALRKGTASFADTNMAKLNHRHSMKFNEAHLPKAICVRNHFPAEWFWCRRTATSCKQIEPAQPWSERVWILPEHEHNFLMWRLWRDVFL